MSQAFAIQNQLNYNQTKHTQLGFDRIVITF